MKNEFDTPVTLEYATELLQSRVRRIDDSEKLPLRELSGRTLAGDVCALHDQPPFPRSPLDGYAVRAADTAGACRNDPVTLRVIAEVDAGGTFEGAVGEGEAVRIMTGAPIPEDCDAVIGQEDTDYGESTVNVYISVAPYENYCRQGEDYRRGDILLPDRTHIGPVETGIIGSLGIAEADVYRKPRVLLMSTGDELVMPGSELTPGKIYDSNLFTFEAMLRDWGAEVVVAIHSSDDPEDAVEKITRYAESVDLIITTGGVSVGKKDIMHDVFRIMDVERIFWKIAMKPGMAMLSGIREETLYLALSGNPYAAFADMHLVVRQVICELTGDDHLQMIRGTAVLADSYKKSSPARRFVRAYVQDGVAHIEGHTGGNGDIAPGIGINALLDIPGDSGELRPGDKVSILYL